MQQDHDGESTILTYSSLAPEKPWWVKMGIWGVPSRSAAWGYLWVSVLLAIKCTVAGFYDDRWRLGSSLFISAWLYWITIRWMDQHHAWPAGKA